jgi:addiction module HigA family antidote
MKTFTTITNVGYYYSIIEDAQTGETVWTINKNARSGDTVLLYVCAPVSAIVATATVSELKIIIKNLEAIGKQKVGLIMTNRRVAEAFHPGVFLEEELEYRGWSQLDLAEILGKSPRDINLIIKGKLSITPNTAIALASAFPETSAQFWMNLETSFQLWQSDNPFFG